MRWWSLLRISVAQIVTRQDQARGKHKKWQKSTIAKTAKATTTMTIKQQQGKWKRFFCRSKPSNTNTNNAKKNAKNLAGPSHKWRARSATREWALLVQTNIWKFQILRCSKIWDLTDITWYYWYNLIFGILLIFGEYLKISETFKIIWYTIS